MNNLVLKSRLTLMNFLEFAVWGAYLTCMGAFLATNGYGDIIGWFYAVQGIVSLFMPGIMGIVADRWVQAQRLLSLCHMLAGSFMIAAGVYGLQEGFKTFGKNAHGFLTNEATLIAMETRTSSPVRILRDRDTLQHVRLQGLFPCGEGAGYAGGIVSAGVDGERCAEMCAEYLKKFE